MSDPSPCIVRDGRCQGYQPGHNTHWIHARLVGETPWGWRDAVVSAVDGSWVAVTYVDADHEVRLWHHQELGAELPVGTPVRLHEQYYVLGASFGWLNVVVRGGLGQVPVPTDVSAWQRERTGGVQDLGTGRALALDWRQDEER